MSQPRSGEVNNAGLLADVARRLADRGLILRGGFSFDDTEPAPAGPDGRPAATALLVGNAGGRMWPHFRQWRDAQSVPQHDPLDRWTRLAIEPIAQEFSARAVFPFDRPWLPFQQWAMRAQGLRPSPLGILIDPQYGLWHAYRAALLLETDVSIQALAKPIHPCDLCREKPCLSTCPVDAFSQSGFAVEACRGYLAGGHASQTDSSSSRETSRRLPACMSNGCAAREACPVGAEHRYDPEQIRFHMQAFRK
jgi:hypothetical protein